MFRNFVLRAAAAVAVVFALHAQSAPPGFRHWDPGFEGRFEDELHSWIELTPDGKAWKGALAFQDRFTLAAEERNGRLEGRARMSIGEVDFSAAFDGDFLRVSVGAMQFAFRRVVAPDPNLVDLGPVVADADRKWTIAVYLGGDNDLEQNALSDLEELRSAMPETGVEVIVLLDRWKGLPNEDGGWTDAHVFRLKHGVEGWPIVKSLGEVDTTDPRVLAGFLEGAFKTFPAEHYAAVIWDHGAGWPGVVVDEDVPGRPGAVDLFDHYGIRVAIRTALWHCDRLWLDLLAFDACLMAQLEVALDVRELSRVLVASEANVPGRGFPYDKWLPHFADPAKSPGDLAADLVREYGDAYDALHKSVTTISAFEIRHLDEVVMRLDELAAKLLARADDEWPAMARALYYGETYEARKERITDDAGCSRDLLDVLQRMRAGMHGFPAKEFTALEEALGKFVLASRVGETRRLSRGLSIFAPFRAGQWNPNYATTALGGASRWPELLHRVHSLAQAASKEHAQFADVKVLGSKGPGTPVRPCEANAITFTLTGKAVVAVEQWDMLRDGPGWAVLRKNWVPDPVWMKRAKDGVADEADRFMPVFVDGKNELAIELTGLQYAITNDADSCLATIDATAPSIDEPLVARAHLYKPGVADPIAVEVLFHRATWADEGVFEEGSRGAGVSPREVTPEEGDTFRFLLESIGDGGEHEDVESRPLAWKRGFGLVLVKDEPGEYRSQLHALDMAGERSSTQVDYTLEASPDLDAWIASWKDWDPDTMHATWNRELYLGGEWRDLKSRSTLLKSPGFAKGIFRVESTVQPGDPDGKLPQTWIFDLRGVPNLRIVTRLEGQRSLCWYGPVGLAKEKDRPMIVMKAINVGGIVWRWKLSLLDLLMRTDGEAKK
ncbi:MAG: hypothetical protein HZA53_07380 [Planctomycetes bacterium]|nr:hypothetical protein [Planctomycetota bacterium]